MIKKFVFLPLCILLISSCTTIRVNRIPSSFYLYQENQTIDESSTIAIVGALPSRYTQMLTSELTQRMEEKSNLSVIPQNEITSQYPSYPCNIISLQDDLDWESQDNPGEFYTQAIYQIQRIGQDLDTDYILMVYAIYDSTRTTTYTTYGAYGGGSSSTVNTKIIYTKGILWDTREDKEIGRFAFHPSGSFTSRMLIKDAVSSDNLDQAMISKVAEEICNEIRINHF